jgi:hypothetical protein
VSRRSLQPFAYGPITLCGAAFLTASARQQVCNSVEDLVLFPLADGTISTVPPAIINPLIIVPHRENARRPTQASGFPILTSSSVMAAWCLALAGVGCVNLSPSSMTGVTRSPWQEHCREAGPPHPPPDAHQSPTELMLARCFCLPPECMARCTI